MQLKQKVTIPMPSDAVWKALNDPDVLQKSLAGCQSFVPNEQGGFDIVMQIKIGPVRAKFLGEVALSDIVEGESYVLSGSGKGGVAGHAKGSALVSLQALDAANTVLTYSVEAHIGGKLAQVGSRLIHGATRKMANHFFTQFIRLLCEDESLEITVEAVDEDEDEAKE